METVNCISQRRTVWTQPFQNRKIHTPFFLYDEGRKGKPFHPAWHPPAISCRCERSLHYVESSCGDPAVTGGSEKRRQPGPESDPRPAVPFCLPVCRAGAVFCGRPGPGAERRSPARPLILVNGLRPGMRI